MRRLMKQLVRDFEPFMFVMVMASGISSNLLYDFAFPSHWMRVCSYIMFGIACAIFIVLQIYVFVHAYYSIKKDSFKVYFKRYYAGVTYGPFWDAYPMGLATIINYISFLANNEAAGTGNAKRLIVLAYALWWYDQLISLLTAWGVSFLIWQKYDFDKNDISPHVTPNQKSAAETLKSVLLLGVIPLVVASSSLGGFTMSPIFIKYFGRHIQLLNIFVCALSLFHALIFVFFIITIYIWSLYVNKIPPMGQVFSMFLILGPLGQGSYSFLLIGENVEKYTHLYYRPGHPYYNELLVEIIPWCFKIIFLLLVLALVSLGYFFTFLCFISILSYSKTKDATGPKVKRIYTFHKGWLGMTFPMGTMSLANKEIYVIYNNYVPVKTFRYIGAIYGGVCICWTIICLTLTLLQSIIKPVYFRYSKWKETEENTSTEKSLESSNDIQESCQDDFTRLV